MATHFNCERPKTVHACGPEGRLKQSKTGWRKVCHIGNDWIGRIQYLRLISPQDMLRGWGEQFLIIIPPSKVGNSGLGERLGFVW